MLCAYYSENSGISKEQADKYIKFNKAKQLDDVQMISSAIINPLYSLVLIIGAEDNDVINIVVSTKLSRNICVITRDIDVASKVSTKITEVFLLDDTTECMVDIWTSPIVGYENMLLLEKIGKRPMYYKFSMVKDTFFKVSDVVEDEVDGKQVYYIELKNLTSAESVKELKKEISAQSKKIKAILTKKKSERSKAFVALKSGVGQQKKSVTVYSNISEYITKNKYATEAQVKQAEIDSKKKASKNVTAESLLCEQGVFSKEDLVVLLRGYLNEQIIGMDEIESFEISYRKVSQKLRKAGVIEAYSKMDTEFDKTLLIMPYTLKDELMDTVNKTISYSKVMFTLPEYVEAFNGEFTY